MEAAKSTTPRPRVSRSKFIWPCPWYGRMKRSVNDIDVAFPLITEVCVATHTENPAEPEVVSILQLACDQLEDAVKGELQGVNFKKFLLGFLESIPDEDKFLQVDDTTGSGLEFGAGYDSKYEHEIFRFRVETESGELATAKFVSAVTFLPRCCSAVFCMNKNFSHQLVGNLVMALVDNNTDWQCNGYGGLSPKDFVHVFAFTVDSIGFAPEIVSAEFVETHENWRKEIKLKTNFTASSVINSVKFEVQPKNQAGLAPPVRPSIEYIRQELIEVTATLSTTLDSGWVDT